jgi:hypothetical protein
MVATNVLLRAATPGRPIQTARPLLWFAAQHDRQLRQLW